MNSSVHTDNKKKDILIFGKCPTQGRSRSNRKFCLKLHYDGSNSFLFVNATKIYQFKAKDIEIKIYHLCLGNISGAFSPITSKKPGLNGCADDFRLIIEHLILLILSRFINIY